jgi:hypothetical protein
MSWEPPFVPTVLIMFMLSFFVIAGLSVLQSTPEPACICRDAESGADLIRGHLPNCPSYPPESYSEFRLATVAR